MKEKRTIRNMFQDSSISRREMFKLLGSSALFFLGCQKAIPLQEKRKSSLGPPILFAQISDTHFGYPDTSEEELLKLIAQINKIKPSFVIHTGDIAHFDYVPEWEKFREVFQSLQVPLYTIPGNHDTGSFPNIKSLALWQKHMGEEKFSFIFSDLAIIGIDLTPFWQFDWEKYDEQQIVRRKTLAWLLQELKKADKCKARFVFGHFPIYLTSLEDRDYSCAINERKLRIEIIDTLIKGNCDAYFCGHTHFGWGNSLKHSNGKTIPQFATTALSYPCLINELEEHSSLKEKNHLGWNLWKYYSEKRVLEYDFMALEKSPKTIIFPRD